MRTIEELKRARRVGAPLVAIQTPDQWATLEAIRANINGGAAIIAWDIVRGFRPMNEQGKAAYAELLGGNDPLQFTNLTEALNVADKLPERAVLVLMNAAGLLEEPQPIQAVMNLRDPFKATTRTLVMLGPDFRLPAELAQDVLVIDEALPTADEIGEILDRLYTENDVDAPAETRERAVDALRGLAAFPIEQAAALSLRAPTEAGKKISVELDDLWDRKRRMIGQTRGLAMESKAETFDQIGGLDQAKQFTSRLFAGRRRPRVVVFIDEIEKALGGSGSQGQGDTSGVTQDSLGVLLTEMQDRKYSGMIAVGPPGSGKTLIARAVASTHNVPCIRLDLGAAKGSLVGQSEQQIRAALKAILAMAGERGAFFVATCNKLDSLPPELRRRFRAGVWFFDLPDKAERATIGGLQEKNYSDGFTGTTATDAALFFAPRDGWSGANIADCCDLAYAMAISLEDAAAYVVPAALQDPDGLARLRAMAHGRFLSASKPGKYMAPAGTEEAAAYGPNVIGVVVAAPSRKLDLGGPVETPKNKKDRGN
jgi:hypothetical protein